MNKKEFKREYSKWRSFMRGQYYMLHGKSGYGVRCDASDMAFDYMHRDCPRVVKDAILTINYCSYCELSTDLTKEMFHTHVLMNMRLPSSFRRK